VNRTVRTAHLVFGLLFLGIAATWLLYATGVLSVDQLTLSGPVVLIAAGVIGLVVSLAGARRKRVDQVGYEDPSLPPTHDDTIGYTSDDTSEDTSDDLRTQENDHE
jgi:hypothetical protein